MLRDGFHRIYFYMHLSPSIFSKQCTTRTLCSLYFLQKTAFKKRKYKFSFKLQPKRAHTLAHHPHTYTPTTFRQRPRVHTTNNLHTLIYRSSATLLQSTHCTDSERPGEEESIDYYYSGALSFHGFAASLAQQRQRQPGGGSQSQKLVNSNKQ